MTELTKRRRILFVFGTRPEAIKMAPLIRLAKADPRFEPIVCSTGQHREMLVAIFTLFEIRPDFDFELMRPGQTLKDITVAVLERLTTVVRDVKPDWIVVQGDTTTAMAASLCGFYERVPVAHVEAGLRTGDTHSPFPEEFNRRVTALIAKRHFAPTQTSADNLLAEGIHSAQILVTGNTGIDALMHVSQKLQADGDLAAIYQRRFLFLNPKKKMILVTVHRRESFGAPLRNVMRGLLQLAEREDVELLIPLHPNPQVREAARDVFGERATWVTPSAEASGASRPDGKVGSARIWLIEPQDYLDFVYLMRRSYFIISDSGGIQEEAPRWPSRCWSRATTPSDRRPLWRAPHD